MKKVFVAFLAVITLLVFVTPTLVSTYPANTKSGKFHFSDCLTIKHPNASHFVPYESRDACMLTAMFRAEFVIRDLWKIKKSSPA